MSFSKGFLYSFLAALAWAVNIILIRILLQNGEDVFNLLFWSTLLALPFWLYLLGKSKNEIKKLHKNDYILLISMGIISSLGVNLTEYLALKFSQAINYSFLIRTVMLFTFLFAYLFLGEKITKKKIILATFLLTGAYFLTTKGKIIYFSQGDLYTILNAALIAFGNNVLGKMATNRMSPAISASITMIIGFFPRVLLPIFLTNILIPTQIWIIIFITLTYILLTQFRFTAYTHVSASYVTMIFSFTPVIVTLIAVPFLHEILTPVQILGGILIIFAGIMVEKLKI